MKRHRQKLTETFEYKEKNYDREVDLKSGKVLWYELEAFRNKRFELLGNTYLELETQYELNF